MDNNQLASEILQKIGGENNVSSVTHCATRLRFYLKDRKKVDKSEVEKISGVVTVMESAGQFQVVIGNNVPEVYKAIDAMSSLGNSDTSLQEKEKQTLFVKFVDLISGLFTPLLGVMAGAGILKGLISIAVTTKILEQDTSTLVILNAIADSLFYFLPILLAITSAKKFKANIYVAVTIAGALVYPTIIELASPNVTVDFFGIPVVMVKYTSTVIPIVLSIYIMSILEQWLNKKLHQTIKNFVTPMILLVVVVPLTLLIFGPFGVYVGDAVASVLITIIAVNPIIAGAIIAASWQLLVMFGLHWGIVPVMMNNIASAGKDPLKPSVAISVFAQAGAIMGVALKTKNKEFKALATSAGVTALFGITEPGVYGVTLRLKRPFVIGLISAAVGGGIAGYAGSMGYAAGPSSILMIPTFYGTTGEGFIGFIIAIITSFLLALVLTYLIGFEDIPVEDNVDLVKPTTISANHIEIEDKVYSPLTGQVIALDQVKDKAFASGALGDGVAILPIEGVVVAPFDGKVAMAFNTGHAVGLVSNQGVEVLIHVGLDTVQLDGKHFELLVEQGQGVKRGEELIRVDLEKIEQAGFDLTTPIVITNSSEFDEIVVTDKDDISQLENLMTVL